MTILYKRNAFVRIGEGSQEQVIPNDFKIEFSVTKIANATSSTGYVSIYNLADSTKELIRDRAVKIRLFAGYGDTVGLLHYGDILRTTQQDNGSDRKTIIFFGDNIFAKNISISNVAYQGSNSIRQIVSDALPMFNTLTFNQKIVSYIPASATISNFSFSGKTGDMLNNLLRPLNIQWFEKNGEILFSKKDAVTSDQANEIFELNSNSGLIKTAVQTDRGVNATCLLNPRLQAGTIVKIDTDVTTNSSFGKFGVQKSTKNVTGFYKIIQATYEGDNWDGKFQVLLQCVPYDSSQEQAL